LNSSARGWIAIAVGGIATLGTGAAGAADSAIDRMLNDRSAVTVYTPAAAAPAQVAPAVETRSYSFDRFLGEGTPSYGARAPEPAPLVAVPDAPRAATNLGGFFSERYPLDLRRPVPAALVPAGTTPPTVQFTQPTVIVEAPAPPVAAQPVATPQIATPQAIADATVRSPAPLVDGRKFGPIETPRIAAARPVAVPPAAATTPAPPAGAIAPDARRLGPAKVEPAALAIDSGRVTEQRTAALPPRPAVAGSDEALAVLLRDFAPPLPPGAAGTTPTVAPPTTTTGVAPPPDTGPEKLRRHDYAFPTLGRQGGPFEAPGRMSTPVTLPSTNR